MKKILVTGATGFIGSHISEMLTKKGFNVVAFDRYNPNYSLGCLEASPLKKNIEFIFGDIRDYDSVYKAIKKVDVVIHLAALIGIPYSYHSPLAYYKTNVEGTYNILESAKNFNIDQTIITSTSEIYGTGKIFPMNEYHPQSAQSPYAASKIGADHLAISYWNSFKTPIKIVRPFNAFGPRQSMRALIPTIIIQALNNRTIKVGNLSPSRDFTYVEDTADAFLKVLNSNQMFGKVANVGTGKEYKVKEIIQLVKKILKVDTKISLEKKRQRIKGSEVERLLCCNKLIKKTTNWKPKHSFVNGLKKTIDWFSERKDKYFSNLYNI
jgi:NAD dependent epimerase/dehydratase